MADSEESWEKKLPLDYETIAESAHLGPLTYDSFEDLYDRLCSHVLLGDGTEGYWIDRTTGGVFRSYSAKALQIKSETEDGNWSWVTKEGSRFSEVAYLDHSKTVEVTGEVRTRLPSGSYTLTWVLQFNPEITTGWNDPLIVPPQPVLFFFADGARNFRSDLIYFPLTADMVNRVREGGWLEYDHHTFTVEDADENEVNIKFSLTDSSPSLKGGLYLDGVIIRPAGPASSAPNTDSSFQFSLFTPSFALDCDPTQTSGEAQHDFSASHPANAPLQKLSKPPEAEAGERERERARALEGAAALLPPEWETIVKSAKGGPLQYDSLEALYDRLCHHVLLGDGSSGFWIDQKTNGVCRSYSARTLQITWGDNEEYWTWRNVNGSRFEEVAFLQSVCYLQVTGEVTTRLPKGSYTLAWVLRFDDDASSRQSWENKPVTIFATDGTLSKTESLLFPLNPASASRVLRRGDGDGDGDGDGWMELDALRFTVDDQGFGETGSADGQTTTLKFSLAETHTDLWKWGMYVDGIVIRPTAVVFLDDTSLLL